MKPVKERPLVKAILIVAFLLFAIGWGLWKFQYSNKDKSNVIHIQTRNTEPPTGKGLLPEQRRQFALGFVIKFSGKESEVTVTTKDAYHTTMFVQSDAISSELVDELAKNNSTLHVLRTMGFKHLVMTNGKATWDIDLKN